MHRYLQQHVETPDGCECRMKILQRMDCTIMQNEYTRVGHELQYTPAVCRSVLWQVCCQNHRTDWNNPWETMLEVPATPVNHCRTWTSSSLMWWVPNAVRPIEDPSPGEILMSRRKLHHTWTRASLRSPSPSHPFRLLLLDIALIGSTRLMRWWSTANSILCMPLLEVESFDVSANLGNQNLDVLQLLYLIRYRFVLRCLHADQPDYFRNCVDKRTCAPTTLVGDYALIVGKDLELPMLWMLSSFCFLKRQSLPVSELPSYL
jgi:hypothetical protein